MPKREPLEVGIDLTRAPVPIKREQSPIDVDMLLSGNKDEPIVIDSDSEADEVDAQMEADDEAARDELVEEESEGLEYLDILPKAKKLSAEEEGTASAETLSEGAHAAPEEDAHHGSSQERNASPPASLKPERSSSAEPVPSVKEETFTVAASKVHSESSEPADEAGEDFEWPRFDNSGDRAPTKSQEPEREPTPAPGTPPYENTAGDEDREATPRPQVPASPVSPVSASSSSSDEPGEAVVRVINLLAPSSTQTPNSAPAVPSSTRKRAFGSLDAKTQSNLKPLPRRRDFPRMPATQPAPVTAPLLRPSGSGGRPQSISSDEDVPQAKRARTSTTPGALRSKPVLVPRAPSQSLKPSRRPTKHEDHWHIDGSVVLQLGSVAFRLHRSRLSQQSTFLAALFRDQDGREYANDVFGERVIRARRQGTMDEQPLYVIEGVAAADFAKLLDAMDNAFNYIYEPPEFPELAALLRASLALSFNTLATFATRTLEKMWQSTLPTSEEHPHAGHAEETVVLARTCGLPSLLKRAFYELLRAPALGQSVEQEFLLDGAEEERARRKVSPADLARLIKTREELAAQWARAAALPPDTREFPCPDAIQCRPSELALLAWREAVHASDLYIEYMHDPVAGLQRLCEVDWAKHGFCRPCIGSWSACWRRQREKIWENLDLWLELPTKEDEGA